MIPAFPIRPQQGHRVPSMKNVKTAKVSMREICLALLLAVLAIVLSACGRKHHDTTQKPATITTNVFGIVYGRTTNILLVIRLPGGGATNIFLFADEHTSYVNQIEEYLSPETLSPDWLFRYGDFWLPGEYERMLADKKRQRGKGQTNDVGNVRRGS
jgi:hypothetical protein